MKVYILIHKGDNSVSYTFKDIIGVYATEERAKQEFENNRCMVDEVYEEHKEEDCYKEGGDTYVRVEWDGYYDELSIETYEAEE